jgi:methyl-galactoside transport system permease protein
VVLGVSAYWQQIIKGIIIVAAVSVDIRKYIRKR